MTPERLEVRNFFFKFIVSIFCNYVVSLAKIQIFVEKSVKSKIQHLIDLEGNNIFLFI